MRKTPDTHYYFGYGSNLDPQQQEKHLRGVLEPVGPGYLPDRQLAFTRRSPRWEGGVLDVRPRRGAHAAGFVFRVRGGEDGWAQLDRKEGAGPDPYGPHGGYRRFDSQALGLDGSAIRVTSYEVCAPVGFVRPTLAYVKSARRGYARLGVQTNDLRRALEGTVGEPVDGAVFVYGTLLRGCVRHRHLRGAALRSVLLAEAEGTLYDHGDYPGFVPSSVPGLTCRVKGEFVSYADIETVLGRLDQIEGFSAFGASGNLFERRLISVDLHRERRVGWTYVPRRPSGVTLAHGCWRTHRGVELPSE